MITPREVSAWGSGKLILFGEHAVVYGEPALAIALPRGLKVTLTAHESARPWLRCAESGDESGDESGEGSSEESGNESSEETLEQASLFGRAERDSLNRALERALEWMTARAPSSTLGRRSADQPQCGYALSVEGALPFKVGLGSSAALSVATLRALSASVGVTLDDEALAEGAMELERVFHKHPSGLDHQTSIHGGALLYQRGASGDVSGSSSGAPPEMRAVEVGAPITLALTWTPRQGSTADAVRDVARRREDQPDEVGELMREIGALTRRGVVALREGNLVELGELINLNHKLLCELGVSSPELNASCEHFRRSGALGAKMSGAGRGGVSFGLFAERADAERAVRDLTTPSWVVDVIPSENE